MSSDHSAVGASKDDAGKNTKPDDDEYDPDCFYSCCKCFAVDMEPHNDTHMFHKLCCYVYTKEGSWLGYYNYSDPADRIDREPTYCTPDEIWCCLCWCS